MIEDLGGKDKGRLATSTRNDRYVMDWLTVERLRYYLNLF